MTELLKVHSRNDYLGPQPEISAADLPKLAADMRHDAEACHTLGLGHFYGSAGLKESRTIALDWFVKAVGMGHAPSMVCVGWLLLDKELNTHYPRGPEGLISAISYLELALGAGITEVGHPQAVKVEDLIIRANDAITKLPSATVLKMSQHSRRSPRSA